MERDTGERKNERTCVRVQGVRVPVCSVCVCLCELSRVRVKLF